jgi:hypothetical protein
MMPLLSSSVALTILRWNTPIASSEYTRGANFITLAISTGRVTLTWIFWIETEQVILPPERKGSATEGLKMHKMLNGKSKGHHICQSRPKYTAKSKPTPAMPPFHVAQIDRKQK